MRLEDYKSLTLDDFKGLWSRGEDDQVPLDHFSDCLNVDYELGEARTRDGLSSSITVGYASGKIRRFANIFNPVGIITLILDEAGNLYTHSSRAGDTATTPLITVAGATDFSAIQMFSRIYIAFHDGSNGLSGVNLKVYIPNATLASDVIRDAAGLVPSAAGAIIAANGAASTLMNAGTYKIAVTYETTSGFLTVPGPEITAVFTPTSYVSPGLLKISLTAIPTGPAGTSKRHILITKADEEEYFFLPSAFGGVINDNTTTTATLDFDDTVDLVSSADYLFDLLETIPAPLGLATYHGRLITWGESINYSILRASYPGDIESFDSVDGIVVVTKDDGFAMANGVQLRDIFYAHKTLGVHAVQDNGDIPANWPVFPIDESINTPIHGISEFFNLSGIRAARDFFLVVDKSGILLCNGSYIKPPITYKINKIWQRINFSAYNKIVLVLDEQNQNLYCSVPLDDATDNNTILFGCYNECPGNIPEADKIGWAIWQIKPGGSVKNATAMGLAAVLGDKVPNLKIGSVDGGGKIWKIDSTVTTDDGTAIESYIESALLFWNEGNIHFFTAVQMRITGSGSLEITIKGEDNILPTDLYTAGLGNALVLSTTSGKHVTARFNFQNEKAKIKLRMTSGKFILSTATVFGKPIYTMRPL